METKSRSVSPTPASQSSRKPSASSQMAATATPTLSTATSAEALRRRLGQRVELGLHLDVGLGEVLLRGHGVGAAGAAAVVRLLRERLGPRGGGDLALKVGDARVAAALARVGEDGERDGGVP